MNFKEHKKDFNKRWNITLSNSPEEAFKKFKQRILNILQLQKMMDLIRDRIVFDFCQYYGIKDTQKEDYYDHSVINRVLAENTEKEFYRLIEVILCLVNIEEMNLLSPCNREAQFLKEKVKQAVELSDINVSIVENSKGQIILYPKGEKELDEKLVNTVLFFLNEKSNKHFEEALKFYQSKKPVKSAESLRRSLEEFLRHKLENTKGLKANIETLQKQLKNNSHSEIRNIIFQNFKYLDKYFDEHSKHNDGNIKEPENEFLIYQTGLLMRYINEIQTQNK